MAVIYITVGAILAVWTAVWYVYLHYTNAPAGPYFWCYGLFFTGLTLIVIGLALGRIGRAARHAELPPEAPNQPTAQPAPAAGTPLVVQGYPAQGQVVMPMNSSPTSVPVAPPPAPVSPPAPNR
jgi:hypothetical protein